MVRLTLLILMFSINGYARCHKYSIGVWPASGEIVKNSIFIITGYYEAQPLIRAMADSVNVFLECEGEKIQLYVTEILEGDFRLTQALLKSKIPLSEGKEYALQIEGIVPSKFLHSYMIDVVRKWTVKNATDIVPHKWKHRPLYVKSVYHMYGDGPVVHVIYKMSISDESDVIVRTLVKNLTTGKETVVYLPLGSSGQLYIGKDFCSGFFDLELGSDFEVEFFPIDFSGNITPWNWERLTFESPKE